MRDNLARRTRSYVLVLIITFLFGFTVGSHESAWAQTAAQGEDLAATETAAPLIPMAQAPRPPAAELPDAPAPEFSVTASSAEDSGSLPPGFDFVHGSMLDASGFGVTPNPSERVPLNQCPYDTTHARECRVHWKQLLISSAVFLTFQNVGNLYTGYWYRYETGTGKWFDRWIDSAGGWRWNVWADNNPFLDDYVGHPMMGGITNSLWIQNDPKGMTLELSNTWPYWRSRLRALAFSTVYSFQWKLGPFGEAGIGHNGDQYFHDQKTLTNETGWVELVTTPVGGFGWTIAEDALDRYVVKRLEEKQRRPMTLLFLSFLTPARATANIFRFRPPWYRDGRVVKANSFWSFPDGPEQVADATEHLPSGDPPEKAATPNGANRFTSASVHPVRNSGEALPVWPHPGGVHEVGTWWGFSGFSGHIWGYADDIKYMPIDVTYSYLINPGARWNFRYAPELTAVAMLDEPTPYNKSFLDKRKRTYGSGISPVGFRASFYPESRVQPFLSSDGGFIYFMDRVLSQQGSQFMYTIDFGGGVQFIRKERQSISVGYRYQHLSNANISQHNPGTDANTFYVAISRFRTKGYR